MKLEKRLSKLVNQACLAYEGVDLLWSTAPDAALLAKTSTREKRGDVSIEEMLNKEAAFIEAEKLGYLFRGKNKGGYFLGLGFSQRNPEVLRDALLRHDREHGVEKVAETDYGIKYNLAGELMSPDGRNPRTRTIWQIDRETGDRG